MFRNPQTDFTLSRTELIRHRILDVGVFILATVVGCGQPGLLAQGEKGDNPSNALVSNPKPLVVPFKPIGLDRIQPGTVIFDENKPDFAGSPNYSNLLLFVRGSLTAGDVSAVTSTTKYYADLFNLVYLANVRKVGAKFELEKVSVGFSSKIGKRDIVVNSASAKELGLRLSFIGEQVLSGNESALNDIKVVAKNSTMALIDAPTAFHHEGKNQMMLVRFFVWVSEEDGRMGNAVWLLKEQRKTLEFVQPDIVYLPPNMIEDRIMYVDKNQFTLGIPGKLSFGLVSLPKGKPYNAKGPTRKVGAETSFTPETFEELFKCLAETMNPN